MPLASCPAAYQSSVRRGAEPADAQVGLHGARPVDQQQRHVGQVGDPGYVGPAALGPPAVEGLGHLVEDARRRQVADQHQQAATGTTRRRWSAFSERGATSATSSGVGSERP